MDEDRNSFALECSENGLVVSVRNPETALVNFMRGSILTGSSQWGCVSDHTGPAPFYRKVKGTSYR